MVWHWTGGAICHSNQLHGGGCDDLWRPECNEPDYIIKQLTAINWFEQKRERERERKKRECQNGERRIWHTSQSKWIKALLTVDLYWWIWLESICKKEWGRNSIFNFENQRAFEKKISDDAQMQNKQTDSELISF